jgi:hypothetical protein
MASAYVVAKAGLSAREQAKVAIEQQKWLMRRNRCGSDASCIERSITERRDQLRLAAAGTGGLTAAVQDRFSPFGAQNPTLSSIATDRDAAATIERLARPQEGLRPLAFPVREGLPVFGLDPNSNVQNGSRSAGSGVLHGEWSQRYIRYGRA